jgi:putative hydrolase of the HAD superfamily
MAGRLGVDPSPEQVAAATELRRSLPARLFGLVPDDILAVLDTLRADGHPLGVVSNATAESAEAWPDGPLAGRFDVEPSECVFVGDGSDGELAGAQAVGMTVFRTTEFRDTLPTWSGPVIGSLTELPGVLRALSSVQ